MLAGIVALDSELVFLLGSCLYEPMKASELRKRLNAHTSSSSKQRSTGGADEEDKNKGDAWWGDLLVFLIVGLGTIWLYCDVIAWEAGEGNLQGKTRLLYDIIGKWGLVGVPAFISLTKLCTGVVKLWRELFT